MYQTTISKIEIDFLKLVSSIGRTPNKEEFLNLLNEIIDENIDENDINIHGLSDTFYYVVGDEPEKITRLFTAHYDTVRETVVRKVINEYPAFEVKGVICDNGYVSTIDKNILGADDRAGCLVLANMIKAGVEGIYVFFPDEESGAGSSAKFSEKYDEIIGKKYPNIKYAIAFDRKGYGDIITSQGQICCSQEFANALIVRFAEFGMFYQTANGIFTDTANLVYNIPECTNISVGYFNHHMETEWQNLYFLHKLIETVASKEFWEFELPATRKLSQRKLYDYGNRYDTRRLAKSTLSSKESQLTWNGLTYNRITNCWEESDIGNESYSAYDSFSDVIQQNNENKGLSQPSETSIHKNKEEKKNTKYTRIRRTETLGTLYSGGDVCKLIMRTYPHKFSTTRLSYLETITLTQAETRHILQLMIGNKKRKYDSSIEVFTALIYYAAKFRTYIKLTCCHDLTKDDFDNSFNEEIFDSIFI